MKSLSQVVIVASLLLFSLGAAETPGRRNLVENPDLELVGDAPDKLAHFLLRADAARRFGGTAYEFSSQAVALDSANDLDHDGKHEGSLVQDVPIRSTLPGRWFRFQLRGLPEDAFAVANDDLHMKVDFSAEGGTRPLDSVSRKLYPLIEQERRDLARNGVGRQGGAATWKTYGFEFRLPFPEIDQVRLIVGFRGGQGKGKRASFLVDDISLEAIPTPSDAPPASVALPAAPSPVDPGKLVALGGRWYYSASPEEASPKAAKGLKVSSENADRLFFKDGSNRFANPFAENMAAWLRKGYLDRQGNVVESDKFRPDNVTVQFDGASMIVHARNLPNHPTAKFPSPAGSGDRNPSYIQEHDYTYHIPLNPERNAGARAMDANNANRALPGGAIGIATNGVVFYNPFDANMTDAADLMDRCCGHPSPDNRYHYHKYPICVKSPFADEGKQHSPLIGWAFDGFAIYGPYEAEAVMAKDSKTNPLNAFNVHRDEARGWHYHVTPGKFPYIIGGYWGKVDSRNGPRFNGEMAERNRGDRGGFGGPGSGGPGPDGPGGPGPGGPGGGRGPGRPGEFGGFRPPPHPLMVTLDADHDGSLSASEIAKAPELLKSLDSDGDGVLSPDELRPPPPPGGFGPRGPFPGPGPGPERDGQ